MGIEEMGGMEYAALMSQARELGRTAQWCWTGAAIASAVLLSGAIGARNPGLLVPVVLCSAFGFYATVHARRQARLIEGYVREFHEGRHAGANWYTRLAQLTALPGFEDRTDWLPLALACTTTLVAVVLSWVYANGAAHGELMAGLVTMGGVGFSAHAIIENVHLAQARSAGLWSQAQTGPREVPGAFQRTGPSR